MPRNQRQQLEDQAPLLYSSLTTWCSTYLTWVLVVSSHFPHVIRRTDLGNEVAQLLLSSNCAFKVPPYVNDIAAAMPWLLESASIPLSYYYKSVAINLHLVCDSHGDKHIRPIDAHLKILQVCYTVLLHCFYPNTIWEHAEAAIMAYLPERWGGKIHNNKTLNIYNVYIKIEKFLKAKQAAVYITLPRP
jgi:hypothetical protein